MLQKLQIITGKREQEWSNIHSFCKRIPLRKICCESLQKVERVISQHECFWKPDYKFNWNEPKGHLQYIKSLEVRISCVLRTRREIYFENNNKIKRTRNTRKIFCTFTQKTRIKILFIPSGMRKTHWKCVWMTLWKKNRALKVMA